MAFVADRPEGPWSDPSFIDIDGIDPPTSWTTTDAATPSGAGVRIVPLSDDGLRAVGEPRTIWAGTGERGPEGPHLFKKDGRYYAILAEGGTGYGHRISVARSDSLYGPYEPSPYNPVMTQSDPSAPIQRAGHGKLVRTDAGEWWCLYLCGGRTRTVHPPRREARTGPGGVDRLRLVHDQRGMGPSTENAAPQLRGSLRCGARLRNVPRPSGSTARGAAPGAASWLWARNPVRDPAPLPGGGWACGPATRPLGSPHIEKLLLRRETSSTTTPLHPGFRSANKREDAGLAAYIGFANWISCCLTGRDTGRPGPGPSIRLFACVNASGDLGGRAGGSAADSGRGRQSPGGARKSVKGQRREFFWRRRGIRRNGG
jgi:xylan 1,4-beta-xylosidase